MRAYARPTLGCLLILVLALPALAAGLDGKWDFVFQTEAGVRRATATFQVEGEKVTGKFLTFDVKGTFANDKMNLSFPFVYEDGNLKGPLNLKATLEGGKLKGDFEFVGHVGTFEATRAE